MGTKKTAADGKGPAQASPEDFPIVGMGASAGGLEAFEAFFRKMPAGSGIAFIIVTHLDPTHGSLMTELIARYTDMPVVEAEDGIRVKPDHVYIIPPNKQLAIFQGSLQLMKLAEPRGLRMPIDFFLRSLADDAGERAVVVILSGSGSDGSTGLKAIHEAGGMTIVQDVSSAKYSGMPVSAIETGLVDFVVPIEKMPGQLLSYVSHRLPGKMGAKAPVPGKVQSSLQEILLLLRSQTGQDFSQYKKSTLYRRIERRMGLHEIGNINTYVRYMRENQEEIQALFKELLIVVTSFFRDTKAFEALQSQALPRVLGEKPDGASLRVWVPGCATGEEAYSIAILLKEFMAMSGHEFRVQIFATDIDEDAIKRARAGVYPENIALDVSQERLQRFFISEDGTFRIRKEIREMVVFALHNVIKDAPFTKLDILSCRNLLIYLESELQQKVLSLFHFSLKQDGVLFLGESESIGRNVDLFSPLDNKRRIFLRRESVAAEKRHDFGILFGTRMPAMSDYLPPNPEEKEASAADIIQSALLEYYAPPSLLIRKNGEIIYIHGRTGKYLEPASGQATLNALEMARPGFQFELRSAINVAATKKREVRFDGLMVDTGAGIQPINLTVKPFDEPESMKDMLLVVFEDVDEKKQAGHPGKKGAPALKPDERVSTLETELNYTRESMQAIIEELQSTNEELMSSNEELQSTNEELQSTNEELESSQEELQSMNEELITVNAELQAKNVQLNQAEDDMTNLLDSTEIGTIFLDDSLNIVRFTPKATRIINLIPSDIGRPLEHIVMNTADDRLNECVRNVRETAKSKEVELKTKSGAWYLARVSPYRTGERKTAGVVITFTDISDTKRASEETIKLAGAARKYAEGIVETVSLPLIVLDEDLHVSSANQGFYDFFQVDRPSTEGALIYELGEGQWDIPQLRTLLERVLPDRENFADYEVEHEFPGIGSKRLILSGRKIAYEDLPAMILISFQDESDSDV